MTISKLDQVREQYPQYKAIPDKELATALHQKLYPQMDFNDFAKRVGVPDLAEPSLWEKTKDVARQVPAGAAEAFGNALSAPVELLTGKEIGSEVTSPPLQTLEASLKKNLTPDPKSIAGDFTKGISKFMTGFLPTNKVLRGVSWLNGLRGAMAAGAVTDFTIFDPHEKRLSNLVQSVPALTNPVTEFLQAKEDDPAILGRIKQVLEGAALGIASDRIIAGIKALKSGKKVAAETLTDVAPQAGQGGVIDLSTDVAKAKQTAAPAAITATRQIGDLGADYAPTLSKLSSNADIDSALKAQALKVGGRISPPTRITHAQAEEIGTMLGKNPEDLLKKPWGIARSPEEIEAFRQLSRTSADELKIAANAARGGSDMDLLRFKVLSENYKKLGDVFLGTRSESGRSLEIWKRAKAEQQHVKSVLNILGGRDTIEKQAALLADMQTPEQIAAAANKLYQATTTDKLMELWINGLLSGPQTHVVNTTSNTITSLWTVPEHFVAGLFGKLHKGDKVYLRETLGKIYGWSQGAKDGVKLGGRAFWTEEPSDFLSKLELHRQKSIGGMTGKLVRLPGRALMAEDEFFKAIGYRQELNALAMRDGLKRGLKGRALAEHVQDIIKKPPPELFDKAVQQARYQTFTKELGATGQVVQKFANSHPAIKLIMPFVRTPVNIVKFAGERTPFALFSKAVRTEIAKGGVARDQALAKITMGSMVGATVMGYAAEGRITGGGPSDPEARQTLYRTGWQPYSIKVGDTYYSYGRLEPLGILFGVAADMAEIGGQIDNENRDMLASMIAASISKNLVSKTWLQGVSAAVEAFDDPDRYMNTFIRNLAGTAVPTGVAQYARSQDPILRDTRTVLDRLKSRLPGYREDLPARRNLWGEPIVLEGGLGPDIISPIYQSKHKVDKVNDEIVRLKMAPAMPQRKINGVELTPEQYQEYVQLAGKPAKKILDAVTSSEQWDTLPEVVQRNIIDKNVADFRALARTQMMQRYSGQLLIQPTYQKASEYRQ